MAWYGEPRRHSLVARHKTIMERIHSGKRDLTEGEDIRGDYALFIERRHFTSEWSVDKQVKKFVGKDLIYFRVIHNGVQQRGHGWIEKGKITQWG